MFIICSQSRILRSRLEYLYERYQIDQQDFLSFDAMRHAAQVTQWHRFLTLNKWITLVCGQSHSWENWLRYHVSGWLRLWPDFCIFFACLMRSSLQRFARSDKRGKLPRWIQAYITDSKTNLSIEDVRIFTISPKVSFMSHARRRLWRSSFFEKWHSRSLATTSSRDSHS